MADDYNLQLIRQKPINYNGLLFYPISFGYICDNIGLDMFDNLLLPFLITKDCLKMSDEELENINLFDDVILNDKGMLTSLAFILQLFCKTKEISKLDNQILLKFEEKEHFVITKDNYEDICQIIMKMNGKSKIKVEKPPKNMSDRQRDVWEKLQAGRKRENEKNTVHIYDMLNICEFGGHYHIPIDEIEKWTLWKIMNCYKARVNLKTYDDSLKICLVSGDGKSISDKNHWHHKLMVRDE